MRLLVFTPLLKMLNQSPRQICINYSNKMINDTAFYDVSFFQYTTSQQKTTASPFKDGTTEYILTLEIVKRNNETIELANFINRKKDKPGSEDLLNSMNQIIYK